MSYKVNNEQGYTLVVTILLLLVFTILGMNLLFQTMNGTNRNVEREGITQAQNLAVKGEDYFVRKINDEIETALGAGKTLVEYEQLLTTTLKNYMCPENSYNDWTPQELEKFKITSNTGGSYFCINREPENAENVDGSTNPYKRKVEIKSIGKSKNENVAETLSHYLIGIAYQEFNYSLSTHLNPDVKKTEDGLNGSLLMFGAVNSNGNINVANHLVTSDKAQYKDYPVPSLKPSFVGENSGNVLASVGGNIYTSPNTATSFYESGITNATASQTTLINDIKNPKVGFSSDIVQSSMANYENSPINVKKIINDHVTSPDNLKIVMEKPGVVGNTALSGSMSLDEGRLFSLTNYKASNPNIYLVPDADSRNAENNSFRIYGHEGEFNNVSFYGDLELRHGAGVSVAGAGTLGLKVANAYIKEDLSISYLDDEFEKSLDRYNKLDLMKRLKFFDENGPYESPGHKTTVKLQGNYYVGGDVRIVNVNLSGDATIYAAGNVTIMFAEIGTTSPNGMNLNIIAGGDVNIRYISHDSNPKLTADKYGILTGNFYGNESKKYDRSMVLDIASNEYSKMNSKMNGLLFSNGVLNLNATTSRLEINGAIHANTLLLQSVRGSSYKASNSVSQKCNSIFSDGDKNLQYLTNSHLIGVDIYSQCFSTVEVQNEKFYKYSTTHIDPNLLPLLIEYRYEYTNPITNRLTINYDQNFASTLPKTSKVTKLDPPERTTQD